MIVSGIAYTPAQANDEVMRGTPLGDELQKMIESGSFGTTLQDQADLIKIRLTQRLSQKDPNKPFMASLSSSGVEPKVYTAAELITEINAESPIGKQLMNNELALMKRVLAVR